MNAIDREKLLTWAKQNAAIFFDLESYHDFRNAVLSGAFDADDSEIQRLRAVLVKARAVMEDALSVGEATYEDFDIKLNPWADLSMGVEEINKILYQTTTEPSGAEGDGNDA